MTTDDWAVSKTKLYFNHNLEWITCCGQKCFHPNLMSPLISRVLQGALFYATYFSWKIIILSANCVIQGSPTDVLNKAF